jgi:hypothetical protein
MIAAPAPAAATRASSAPAASASTEELQARVKKLEGDLRQAREEITELKMLVALYEEQDNAGKLDH